MSRLRIFLAIEPSDTLRRAGVRLINQLADIASDVRWVAADDIHLTIKFLGDVDERDVYGICKITQAVCSQHTPFEVPCTGLGAFPNSERPRTIWMGVTDLRGELSRLQHDVDQGLVPLGIPSESRSYHGHLTLGRTRGTVRHLEPLQQAIDQHAENMFGAIVVREIVVFASELSRSGPVYSHLGKCQLGQRRDAP